MNINIAKNDLYYLRETLRYTITHMESCPNPSATGRMPETARKLYKKITQAQTKIYGHNWNADEKLFPIKNK